MYLERMTLYENIDLAKKFGGKQGFVESLEAKQPDKTATALAAAQHLRESKPAEATPVQLTAPPVAN